jgi:hypothetical protein
MRSLPRCATPSRVEHKKHILLLRHRSGCVARRFTTAPNAKTKECKTDRIGRRKVAPSLRCRRQRRQDHMDSRPLPSPPSSLIHATRRRRPCKCCDRELKRPAFRFAPLRSTWTATRQPASLTTAHRIVGREVAWPASADQRNGHCAKSSKDIQE